MEESASTIRPGEHHPPTLRGRGLRFVLLEALMNRGETTVAELVAVLAERGFVLGGRASKVISDALRWEVRRGRVRRLRRGCYRYRRANRSMIRRVRILARRCPSWLVAVRRGDEPPPTPPDPRATSWTPQPQPGSAPWEHLGWLWVT